MRPLLLTATTILLTIFATTALAASPKFTAGKQYLKVDPPIPSEHPHKIQVTEIFWYHCPHCFAFDPALNKWVANQKKDVIFRRVPAIFGNLWTLDGKIYYTEKALGVLDKMHTPVFNAIHKQHLTLRSEADYTRFFSKHGISKEKFKAAFASFGVHSQVKRAGEYVRKLGVTGVPDLVINGRYRITVESAGGLKPMLKVADYLVSKERKRLQDGT